MATSDSEDFESADEEFESENVVLKPQNQAIEPDKVDSVPCPETDDIDKAVDQSPAISSLSHDEHPDREASDITEIKNIPQEVTKPVSNDNIQECQESNIGSSEDSVYSKPAEPEQQVSSNDNIQECQESNVGSPGDSVSLPAEPQQQVSDGVEKRSGRKKREQQIKPKESKIGSKLGAKKLGARIAPSKDAEQKLKEEDVTKDKEESEISKSNDAAMPSSDKTVESLDDNKPVEEFTSVFDKLTMGSKKPVDEDSSAAVSSGWGWSGWGSSLLSTATASVSTLSSHVSQGISTVIETVEGGLGAPDPTELARQDLDAAMKIAAVKEPTPEEEPPVATAETSEGTSPLFPLGQIFSGVTQLGKIVENTGAKVLSGGLDTLEVIGKKTMEVLQDGDPGLKKKRAIFQPDRPILSQVLREAKNQAEEDAKLKEEKQAAKKVHFETLFDDYQGLIHLEALEMLSRQCEMKLQASLLDLSGPTLHSTQTRLQAVREMCLLPDPDDVPDEQHTDFEEVLKASFGALSINISADRIIKVWQEVQNNCKSHTPDVEQESVNELTLLHEKAISSLAHLTASCVEQFHRTGELLLVQDPRQPEQEAAQLVQITLLESSMVEQLATLFCETLNKLGDPAQPIITKVFLEASNSSTYIQDAFQLLVPVLQVGAV